MFDADSYWKTRFGNDISTRQGTNCTGDHRYHYDFDWARELPGTPATRRYFPGLRHIAKHIEQTSPGVPWTKRALFVKKDLGSSFEHTVLDDGVHAFVFDFETWKGGPPDPVKAKASAGLSADAETARLVARLHESPAAFRQALLEQDPTRLFLGITHAEATQLLPHALQALAEAFPAGGAPPVVDLSTVDQSQLLSALQHLLAIAAQRGDVTSVLGILDALPADKRVFINQNAEIVKIVAEQDISAFEVTSWAYRRAQVDVFKDLLGNSDAVDQYKLDHGITADGYEPAWQNFFERNHWIFGLALDYFFNEPITDERLEVYSLGHSMFTDGRRPDGLLSSSSIIRSLCFVEIKTPLKLLAGPQYRTGVWAPHPDLMGAVAQSQATVHQSTKRLQDRFRLQDSEGLPASQHIYSVRPRSFVVIGRSAEFTDDSGEHRQKVAACFERFRRDLVAPEVYTFDELWMRAHRLAHPSALPEPNADPHSAATAPDSPIDAPEIPT